MFSVVIPLHNKSAHIEKAIESVLKQSYIVFELIVVNDGSTDDSLEKVRKISDPRMHLINQFNAGVSTARNNGVKNAKYEYIAFLDGDDWWDQDFLMEMKGMIEKFPAAKLYGSNYLLVKHGKKKKAIIGIPQHFESGYINYFEVYSQTFWMPLFPSSTVISKNSFNEVGGFKPDLKFGEDFDLWVRIALKYKIVFLNKFLVYYNQDVDVNNRALGGNKLYSKESYYLFNLSYLEQYEIQNKDLKKLLDGMRVRSLLRYYLNKLYISDVKLMLSKVDFNYQPLYYRLIYKVPLPLIKIYFKAKKAGSTIKQSILSRSSKRKLESVKSLESGQVN